MPPEAHSGVQNISEPNRGSWSQAWQTFRSALPLFFFWLLIPAALGLLIGLLYVIQPLVREVYFAPLSASLLVGEWEVRFSYPREVTSDPSLLSRQALSIQASGPAETPPGEVVVEVEAVSERLSLVDEDGRPLPQPFRQALSSDPTAPPMRIYLLAGPSASGGYAGLTLRATSPSAQASQSIYVSLESTWQTRIFGLIQQGAGIAVWGGVLLSAMVGFAVQQWNRMREEQHEEEQKRREALQELEGLRELLRRHEYGRALERYQVLKRWGFFPWTETSIQAYTQDLWNQEAPEELRRWAWLCAPEAQGEHSPPVTACGDTVAEPAKKNSEEVDIQAILWAYRFLPSASKSAPQILQKLLTENPDTLPAAERVLDKDVDGRALLRSPELTQMLQRIEAESSQEELRKCARRLLALQRSPSPWLALWPENRTVAPPLVARGVQALGLRCNPFGLERAEMDPRLGEYGYRLPDIWEYLSSPQPLVVIGGPGSGKTALALLLAYDCQFPPGKPRREGTLPVYLLPYESPFPSSDETSCRYLLDQVARSVAEALLQNIARYPYLFTEQNPEGQAAIVSLWTAFLGKGSGDNLGPHLLRAGLREEGTGRKVWEEVRKMANAVITPDETALLEFLGAARPAGFQRTEVLMDWGAEPAAPRCTAIARSMEAFLRVMPALAARDVHVKVFLHRTAYPAPGWESAVPLVELTWREEDLRGMLQLRLGHAGISSLQEVYSDVAGLCPDPDAHLVRRAKSCPRSLIRLGNQMLARVESFPLTPEHLP